MPPTTPDVLGHPVVSPPRTRSWGRLAGRWVPVVLVAAGCVYLACSVDVGQLTTSLLTVRLWPLGLALVFATLGVVAHATYWRLLVSAVVPVSLRAMTVYAFASYATSAFLPMRAGEALRVWLLQRRYGVPLALSGAVIALEKLADTASLLLLATPLPWLIPDLLPSVSRCAHHSPLHPGRVGHRDRNREPACRAVEVPLGLPGRPPPRHHHRGVRMRPGRMAARCRRNPLGPLRRPRGTDAPEGARRHPLGQHHDLRSGDARTGRRSRARVHACAPARRASPGRRPSPSRSSITRRSCSPVLVHRPLDRPRSLQGGPSAGTFAGSAGHGVEDGVKVGRGTTNVRACASCARTCLATAGRARPLPQPHGWR